jgi:hypothetical protein
MEAVYAIEGTLNPNQKRGVRLCPWPVSHMPPGSAVRFRFEVRSNSISSLQARLYDLNGAVQPAGSFNPTTVMRNLDRDVADALQLIDETTVPDTQQGVLLWTELGMVDEINTPEFEKTRDDSNQREFYLEVENLEGVPVRYTLEAYAEVL